MSESKPIKKMEAVSTSKSLQSQIADEILKKYKDAVIKKIDSDNYLDIHLPSINEKRGTHLGINTAKNFIRMVFYCRDFDFVQKALANSSLLEEYSQGLRPLGDPSFKNVADAVDSIFGFLSEINTINSKGTNGGSQVLSKASAESNPKESTTYTFKKAVAAYLQGNIDYVVDYIQAGNPELQYNGDTLITNELISYVCAFTEVDQRIVDLVESGVDLNESFENGEGYTAVHFAAWDGKNEILAYLLEAGAEADRIGEDGHTPLVLASGGGIKASVGHQVCVELLVERGADVNIRVKDNNIYFSKKGGTPLTISFINGYLETALYLIEQGADPLVLLEPCTLNAPSQNLFVNFLSLVKQGQISAPAEGQWSKILSLVGLDSDENLVVEDSAPADTQDSGGQLDLNEFLKELEGSDTNETEAADSKDELDLATFLEGMELEEDADADESEEEEEDPEEVMRESAAYLQSDDDESDEEEDDEEDGDQEDEDEEEGGFPMISYRKPAKEMVEVVQQYLRHWQKSSQVYAWRMGIKAFIPEFVSALVSDKVCPIFTTKDIDAICSRINSEKIIPILGYVPEDFYGYTKHVWWLVPFCIWKEDTASLVFIDKNGFYGMYSQDGEEQIDTIFNWDSVYELDFEYAYDGDPNINRLTLTQEDGNFLTFDEFVSTSEEDDHGSYLAVIEAIWEARRETIEASKGEPFWTEGAGGEGFVEFETPQDLLKAATWDNPDRPDPSMFGG
jgi:hypothetical protein